MNCPVEGTRFENRNELHRYFVFYHTAYHSAECTLCKTLFVGTKKRGIDRLVTHHFKCNHMEIRMMESEEVMEYFGNQLRNFIVNFA